MFLVFAFLGIALVFAIAAAVVGREARRLDAIPPRPTLDLDEAVEYVSNHVPFEVSAVLSHGDVLQILEWNIAFLKTKGVSGNGSDVHVTETPIVVGGAEAVDYVMSQSAQVGAGYTSDQVRAVLEAQLAYLEAIGAIGPPADENESS